MFSLFNINSVTLYMSDIHVQWNWLSHKNYFWFVIKKKWWKLEKKYAPALDNYGQSCFVRSDLKKKWSVSVRHKWCPSPDHKKL